MKKIPSYRHALWIAPVSLFLAWATPRSSSMPEEETPPTGEATPQFYASPIQPSATASLPVFSTAAECQEALDKITLKPDLHPLIQSALQDHILRTWLDLDPTGALEHAEERVVLWGESFGKELFRVWLDLDPDSALQSLSTASPALRNSLFDPFFTQLADLDPKRTLELIDDSAWTQSGMFLDRRGNVFAHAYYRWAESDPQAALDHYQKNLAHKQTFGFSSWPVSRIFKAWAENDPLAALTYLRKNRKSDQPALSQYEQMVSIEPAIARFVLTQNPDLINEFSNPEYSSYDWVKSDLDGALAFADTLPKDHLWRSHLLVKAAERLATTDPERALSLYLEGQSSPAIVKNPWGGGSVIGFPDSFYHETFQVLNSRDAAHATELLKTVPAEQRALALGGILTHEFAKDPASAISLVQSYYQDSANRAMVDKALSRSLEWGSQSPTEVIAAIPEARTLVKGELLESWARKDPEGAASFISEELTSNPGYQTQSPEALSYLAVARPEFTAQWLETLPAGPVQTDAAVALAVNWSNYDLPATKAWLATLPAGPLRETAEKSLTKPAD